jgi:hypothetical protein
MLLLQAQLIPLLSVHSFYLLMALREIRAAATHCGLKPPGTTVKAEGNPLRRFSF